MLTTIAAAVLATLSPMQGETDTTIAVPAKASLSVNNFGGAIVIHTWTQNRVKVHAEHGSRGSIEASLVGTVLTLKAGSRHGAPSVVDFDITVPADMALNLSGTYTEIEVDGVRGAINAETVDGSIDVRGGSGNIMLNSVQGSVTLADATGRIEVNSINESVELSNISGPIRAETTNGDVTLWGIKSSSVEATTINGDVEYEGTVTDAGTYTFNSHNGDITVSIPEGANVTLSVATANGDINSSFSLPFQGTREKHRYTFKLGTGSARMEAESFQGDIDLRRPAEMRERQKDKDKDKDRNHEMENEEP